jgi:hypothetical protein
MDESTQSVGAKKTPAAEIAPTREDIIAKLGAVVAAVTDHVTVAEAQQKSGVPSIAQQATKDFTIGKALLDLAHLLGDTLTGDPGAVAKAAEQVRADAKAAQDELIASINKR